MLSPVWDTPSPSAIRRVFRVAVYKALRERIGERKTGKTESGKAGDETCVCWDGQSELSLT